MLEQGVTLTEQELLEERKVQLVVAKLAGRKIEKELGNFTECYCYDGPCRCTEKPIKIILLV
jgi:hypothetical protein